MFNEICSMLCRWLLSYNKPLSKIILLLSARSRRPSSQRWIFDSHAQRSLLQHRWRKNSTPTFHQGLPRSNTYKIPAPDREPLTTQRWTAEYSSRRKRRSTARGSSLTKSSPSIWPTPVTTRITPGTGPDGKNGT